MHARTGLAIALVIDSSAASADPLPTPTWLDRVSIRQTSDTKIVPQAANVVATFPENQPNTYGVDAFGQVNSVPDSLSDRLEFGPFAEYHHLKPADKPQQILKLGLKS